MDIPPAGKMAVFSDPSDAATQHITELGGTIQGESFDSPYGRLAQATDDQGVPFLVISAPTQT
ncbi:MAG: VOC family protein, partial [Pseudonocardiaceae bacterium]